MKKEEEKKRPVPIPFQDNEQLDLELPKSLKVNAYTIPVEQISAFEEEPTLFGDFDEMNLKIRIVPKQNKDINKTTLLHEGLHAVDWNFYPRYHLDEPQINILAQSLFQVMRNNNFTPNGECLEEGEEPENACFIKKNGEVKVKNCALKFDGETINVQFVNFEDTSGEDFKYNRHTKTLKITKKPREDAMHSAMVKGFVEAVNEVHNLKISEDKRFFMGQQIYQFIKENPLCYTKKKEPEKKD